MHTLRPYQERAVSDVLRAWEENTSTLLVLPTGCHDPEQGILCGDGQIRKAGEIVQGMTLMGVNGPKNVLKVHRGRALMAKVTPVKGDSFIVTVDHRLSLIRTAEDNNPKYPSNDRRGEIVDISVSDWMKWSSWKKHIYKLFRAPADFNSFRYPTDEESYPHAYLVGALLGDGYLGDSLSFVSADIEVALEVSSLLSRHRMRLKYSSNSGKAKQYIIVASDRSDRLSAMNFRTWLKAIGISGTRSGDKFIPDFYKLGTRNQRLDVLAGLLDTDGSKDSDGYDYTSKSKKLAEDVAFVSRSLGLAAYVKPCRKTCQTGATGTYYRLFISGDCSIIPSRLSRKKCECRKQKKNVLHTGFSAKVIGEGEYVGFSVDGDNRYLLGDFTVTHNSGKTDVACEVVRRRLPKRALFVAHRMELIYQAAERFEQFGMETAIEMADQVAGATMWSIPQVVVATVQTLNSGPDGKERLLRFNPEDFETVIVDECFPAGTRVDGIPIEKIRVGQYVSSFNHHTGKVERQKVLKIFRRSYTGKCVRIFLKDGRSLICTENHPVFSAIRNRYIPAHLLDGRDMVCYNTMYDIQKYMQNLPEGVRGNVQSPDMLFDLRKEGASKQEPSGSGLAVSHVSKGCSLFWEEGERIGKKGKGLLLSELHAQFLPPDFFGNDGEDKPKIRLRKNENQKPDVSAGDSGESLCCHVRTIPGHSGRKWPSPDTSGSRHGFSARLDDQLSTADRKTERKWISDKLQNRRCQSIFESRYRNRRKFTPSVDSPTPGQEKRIAFGIVGVDRVEIYERTGREQPASMSGDGEVFNLEVEGNRNYFAEGVLVHNCHHSPAESYGSILSHFKQNPRLKILGLTATPDRHDEEALGKVFDSVAFDYEILDAIHDGWLVPIEQQLVTIEGLDFSQVRTTAGDLNGADLANVMEAERNMQGVASATMQIIGDTKRTLAFCASVKQAETLAEIFNRRRPGSAAFVEGRTPKEDRIRILSDFLSGKIQIVVNCAVFTEGFDNPGIEVVIHARPTKSRALYAQMIGRGTRPLPKTVDGLNSSEDRKSAILSSAKPVLTVVDFVGNAGRHKLMTTADILGGNVSDEAKERAVKRAKESGAPVDMAELLDEEKEKIRKELEARRLAEQARKAKLLGNATYRSVKVDPFDLFHIFPSKDRGWDSGKSLSEKQRAFLRRIGVDPDSMNYASAKKLLNHQFERWRENLCTLKQAELLKRFGYDASKMKMDEASRLIDAIKNNNWKSLDYTQAVAYNGGRHE